MTVTTGGPRRHLPARTPRPGTQLNLPAVDRPPKAKRTVRTWHRLSPAQQRALVDEYQTGYSVHTLAQRYAINRGTVSPILERHGVPRRYKLLTPEQVHQAIQLYNSGLSLARVGETLSVSPKTIYSALTRRGVRLRATRQRKEPRA